MATRDRVRLVDVSGDREVEVGDVTLARGCTIDALVLANRAGRLRFDRLSPVEDDEKPASPKAKAKEDGKA